MTATDSLIVFVLIATAVVLVSAVGGLRVTAAPLCFLACCPLNVFEKLEATGERVVVLVRGLSVLVSPTAFTMALLHNGRAVMGQAPVLFAVPALVFAMDWLLIAIASTPDGRKGWLPLVRLGVFFCSLFMAVWAALLSESDNLTRNLHAIEDARTTGSAEYKRLKTERDELDTRIRENEGKEKARTELNSSLAKKEEMKDQECVGKRRVDSDTGVVIVGGKCGGNSESYGLEAVRIQKQLKALDDLKTETGQLRGTRDGLNGQMKGLIDAGHSNRDAVGTLFSAISQGAFDAGLIIQIGMMVVIMGVLESFAYIMAEIPVSTLLLKAARDRNEETNGRLDGQHRIAMAAIRAEDRHARTQAGKSLPPIVLHSGKPRHFVGDDMPAGQHKEAVND
jgi:hypothetical protein